jgi:hypothetical protein
LVAPTRGTQDDESGRSAMVASVRAVSGGRPLRTRPGHPGRALVDPTHDGFVRIRPTGTDILRSDNDIADTHRLVMVRPNGTLLLIESIGMPGAGSCAPLSGAQLDELACTLDKSSGDLATVAPDGHDEIRSHRSTTNRSS